MANRGAKKNKNESELYEEQMKFFERNVIGTAEAAKLLGVTQTFVERLVSQEKLEGKRIGPHSLAIYRPSLERYMRNKNPKGRPPSNKPKLEQ